MLCLLGAVLACAGLCLATPVPRTACPDIAFFKETMRVLKNLSSEGSSEVVPLNNVMEAGGNATTYLEAFIEALEKSKESVKQKLLILNLKKIQNYGHSCTGWTAALKEHQWNAAEEYNFFDNLEYFLRFLSHNALPEEKT
ncbi:hypothetical protein BTVI_01041 [Pitangus sulphuratus]|nr:hypothetical protein BTVI_64694 [Pitangus sulphuratus]KAJ7428279.1 hypothetical protein BTVI_01041 [Pitangus sulphuratus]